MYFTLAEFHSALIWKSIITVIALSSSSSSVDVIANVIQSTLFFSTEMRLSPLSQRQTSNGMTKPILYHKTHTAWQKSYCMSFAMPSYFPCIHGKTHVISAPPYPWLFPCSNLSLVSQLLAFGRIF